MRVMHVMAGAETGGAENIFLECVLALDDAGVKQHVVTRGNNAFRVGQFAARGIPVTQTSFNKWWRFSTDAALKKAIAQFQPDVIEYWMGRAGTFAPAFCRERNIGWYGGYYKLARFHNCDWHVGLTPDLVRHIKDQGVPDENVALIHTYAEFEEMPPVSRAALDTPEDAPVLLALARLHWKKGLDILLNALPHIPGAYAWIAGDGPLKEQLETEANLLGVSDRVRFLGWRDDRAALLAACDVVAFPSRYEPFGTVTVDAWAAKRPLVAADSQGPAAYVRTGENGMLVPKDDVDAFAAAVNAVLGDPDLRARIVDGGTKEYEERFTKQAYIKAQLAFYEKVMAQARSAERAF